MISSFGSWQPQLQDAAFVAASAELIGQVSVATDASIWYQCVLRGDLEAIRIGERSNIQEHCVLHTSVGITPCVVGADVTVGHRVVLHGCEIQDHCLIGMGAIIMDQAVVEAGCLVAAGALVTERKVLRSGYLYAGSPARQSRLLTEKETLFLHRSVDHYVSMAKKHQVMARSAQNKSKF